MPHKPSCPVEEWFNWLILLNCAHSVYIKNSWGQLQKYFCLPFPNPVKKRMVSRKCFFSFFYRWKINFRDVKYSHHNHLNFVKMHLKSFEFTCLISNDMLNNKDIKNASKLQKYNLRYKKIFFNSKIVKKIFWVGPFLKSRSVLRGNI